MRILVWALLMLPCLSLAKAAEVFRVFMDDYCVSCHGAEKQKGDRAFHELPLSINTSNDLADYQDILDQLNLSEMPPKKADAHPSLEKQREMITWLTDQIEEYHATKLVTEAPVLRRKNAREYRHAIRDVFNLNLTMYDPALYFPRDQTSEHLDNVGETLVTSGHLLARYLEAADTVLEKAMLPLERPEVRTWEFTDDFRQQPEIDQVHRKTNKYAWMTLYEVTGADKHEGAYGPIHAFAEGVPYDGHYEITVEAEALNRKHPYDRDLVPVDPSEPLRLGIVAGDARAGELQHTLPIEPKLAETALKDGRDTYTMKVWLDKGYSPRFTFPNGSMDMRSLYPKLIRRHPELFPKRKKGGIVENRYYVLGHGKMPQIRIHRIKIRGPIYAAWPKPSQQALLGDLWSTVVENEQNPGDAQWRAQLKRIAFKAFGTPASEASIDRVMAVLNGRITEGKTPAEAFADGVKVILCSPHFLYHLPESEAGEKIAYPLASRLSYFLWSAPPDVALLKLAADGSLKDPGVLKAQVARMLKDPRSEAFIDGFLDSWLTFRDLGSAPPDRATFRSYYYHDLGDAMRQETRLFTRHVIDANRPIYDFIDSDYAFVNRPLAQLYGLPNPEKREFQQVKLTDKRRGGLLGQASVLTVTANGFDTSPVVRGVWLLENILGTPPPPPPPDVEPLDPDVRGATSIRDQLAKHRETPSCYDCHQAIDPIGFALENFDAIGAWRANYGKRVKVDASGELPTGERFDDVVGLKKVLMNRKDRFARALTSKLMAYALGRHVGPEDRPTVDGILVELEKGNVGMQELITQVVLSEPFRGE